MLAPSIITGCKSAHEHESPTVSGGALCSASEEEVLPTIPLASVHHQQPVKGSQEYPVWQAVLRVGQG